MKKLLEGYRTFLSRQDPDLFRRLAAGQSPETLMITCSDSRISPNLVLDAELGSLFVIRNAGNIVPPYQPGASGGEGATVEFAVSHLKVRDIVVMGHSHCAAAKEVVHPNVTLQLPQLRNWVRHAAALSLPHVGCQCETDATVVTRTAQENVLQQLGNLRTHPAVQAALEAGAVQLHGWYFELETGSILAFDPEQRAFVPLAFG